MTKDNVVIFSNNGKTYIGRLCTFDKTDEESNNLPSFNGLGKPDTEIEKNDYWVINAPCEIGFQLVEVPGATSRLEFKNIMPIFPAAVFNSSEGGENIYFAFPKATTIMSNISNSVINGTLQKAYRQMAGLND